MLRGGLLLCGAQAKDASFFGFGEFFNLDAEEAAGRCLSPLTYSERYLAKTVLTPLVLCLGVLVAIPIWNKLRSLLASRMQSSPAEIGRIHTQRALVNTFLFCFAPLTRSSVEALVCVDTCDDPGCAQLLLADMAVTCYEGAHQYTAAIAVLVLMVVALVIPAQLLQMVRHSRRRRDISLHLRPDQLDQWWAELDADRSGFLDTSESKALLRRMGEATTESALSAFLRTLDPDGSGEISRSQFEAWYDAQLSSLVGTPFDVLYGTTHSSAYWCVFTYFHAPVFFLEIFVFDLRIATWFPDGL